MTWLVLRYWYGYHRARFQKWNSRKLQYERQMGSKIFRARWVRKVQAKRDHHAFWFNHYCSLLGAYGHKIECIHFGAGENTTQFGWCPKESIRRLT